MVIIGVNKFIDPYIYMMFINNQQNLKKKC